MNNNFDPNQQTQYQKSEYQYQQPVYQQPLYQQAPVSNNTSFFVLAIVGLALSCSFGLSIVGIILSAIALSKTNKYFAMGGLYAGKAKVAKILSTVGLWAGIGFSIIFIIYVVFYAMIIGSFISEPTTFDPSYYYFDM